MSNFSFITQKDMGTLSPEDRKALRAMERRYERLAAKMEEAELERVSFFQSMADKLQIDTTGPFRAMAVEKTGKVRVSYCPCPSCQAQLNNVSVAEATEAMIQQGLIHADEAKESREFAASVDTKRGKPMIH